MGWRKFQLTNVALRFAERNDVSGGIFRLDYYYITVITSLKQPVREPIREPDEKSRRNIRNWRKKPFQEVLYFERSLQLQPWTKCVGKWIKTWNHNRNTYKISVSIPPNGKMHAVVGWKCFVNIAQEREKQNGYGMKISNHWDQGDDDDVKYARRDWDENFAFGGKMKLKVIP